MAKAPDGFDLSDPEIQQAPHAHYAAMRSDGVQYLAANDAWIVLRHEDALTVLRDPIFADQHAHRNGGYSYLEAFLGRRYSIGLRGDYAEDPFGAANRQRTYSAFATWMPSEFQRLRFQFDQIDATGEADDQRFTLQWTAFLGSHSHGFTNR